MTNKKPSLCLVSASPLTINFFFKPHLFELEKYFQLTIICDWDHLQIANFNIKNVKLISIPIKRKISLIWDIVAFTRILFYLVRHDFDIIVSVVPKAGLLTMVASLLTRVPCRVHIFQGEVWASKKGFIRFFLKHMDLITARFATHVLAVSFSERDFLSNEGVINASKINVLGSGSISGVDINRFKFPATKKDYERVALGIPITAVVCLYLGRIVTDKGIKELISAYGITSEVIENFWLLVAGPQEDNILLESINLLDEDIRKKIIIRPMTDKPERYISAADFLCLPSYREGFGLVIIEAAAAGLPSIGTRIYGITDAIVENETGLIVEPFDVIGLAKAMFCLAEDNELRYLLGVKAYARVENKFNQNIVVSSYVNFFRVACGVDRSL